MSEIEPKSFELRFPEQNLTYVLRLGRCAVTKFRQPGKDVIDYISTYEQQNDETVHVRIFNNQELASWLAGYEIKHQEDNLYRVTKRLQGITFREQHGWNPALIERETPSGEEEEAFLSVQKQLIDQEWEEWK